MRRPRRFLRRRRMGLTLLRCCYGSDKKEGVAQNISEENSPEMDIRSFPLFVFALSLIVLWLAALSGAYLRRRRRSVDEAEQQDLVVILTAALTLLGLVIGFSFSMAVTRYDLRKSYEAEEANAIGTEYVRADLLHTDDAKKVRELLRSYLSQRISFYTERNAQHLEQINTSTAELQSHLWTAVQAAAAAQPTPVVALAVSGMNDVLNSQGYAQAAWWNRIPIAAWGLMLAVAIGCNFLFGYYARRPMEEHAREFLVLPLIVSIAFVLIADMDTPHGGFIRVHPQNLEYLFRSLRAP